MESLIQIQNIGKRYQVRVSDEPDSHRSLKKTIHAAFTQQWKNKPIREFWALKDLSFSLNRGETVAIMGQNGSGKSTLLKLISRIIEPTEGRIVLNGRLGALLEVGTGMHPDLTGRENIYFCGALLGMKRSEVKKTIDAIVAFAEISAFLDAPFKQYSSGMALRLAASVLFHLRTDLLILDEVLSVGDKAFQEICFKKIETLSKEGKIIVCVTHHEEWIKTYCQRGLLLKDGMLIDDGPAKKVLTHYHEI
jgi:lipopolysaccharide transport system ATP-binding protein